jgi:hypothetical protein
MLPSPYRSPMKSLYLLLMPESIFDVFLVGIMVVLFLCLLQNLLYWAIPSKTFLYFTSPSSSLRFMSTIWIFCHCFLRREAWKLAASWVLMVISFFSWLTLPTAMLRQRTFFSWNLVVNRTSSIFSCISSSEARRVENFLASSTQASKDGGTVRSCCQRQWRNHTS